MIIVKPSVVPEYLPKYPEIVRLIERAARTCYKSEDKIGPGSAEKLISTCIRRGHESVLEHGNISLRFTTDRGVTHELVRHRVGVAYSQESTRYCDYKNGSIEFVEPWWFKDAAENDRSLFIEACRVSEKIYHEMRYHGMSPQAARAVLPNALKTEIVVTANVREWRHIFVLRCAAAAHPDMVRVMSMSKYILTNKYPVLFQDL